MTKVFLSAEWRNLLMANYVIEPALLQKYLPKHTELDTFNGNHYISLVGFLFRNVRVYGIAFPFHTNFEEVNLRFYVRYKEDNIWKRGVVFIKEIVPRRIITFIANTLYGENYATHIMKHTVINMEDELHLSYDWKVGKEWNYIKCVTERNSETITIGSFEEFITEHYWGYTFINQQRTGVYEVVHPKWKVHKVKMYDIACNAERLYGKEFSTTFNQKPETVFLAEGSTVQVMKGARLPWL